MPEGEGGCDGMGQLKGPSHCPFSALCKCSALPPLTSPRCQVRTSGPHRRRTVTHSAQVGEPVFRTRASFLSAVSLLPHFLPSLLLPSLHPSSLLLPPSPPHSLPGFYLPSFHASLSPSPTDPCWVPAWDPGCTRMGRLLPCSFACGKSLRRVIMCPSRDMMDKCGPHGGVRQPGIGSWKAWHTWGFW